MRICKSNATMIPQIAILNARDSDLIFGKIKIKRLKCQFFLSHPTNTDFFFKRETYFTVSSKIHPVTIPKNTVEVYGDA